MSSAPVRRQITVAAPQDVAFRVFTARMGDWWKATHAVGGQPFVEVVVEPWEGGRWFERASDGAECPWGRVLVWAPVDRVVLAWQLDADFVFDAGLETEVEVRFVAEGPDRTRVELEHRHLEGLGSSAGRARAALDADGGWQGLLDGLAEHLTASG